MRIEDLEIDKEQIYKIAAKYGISKVFIFGSVARGESTAISDIDFMIEMDRDASALGIGGFQFEVQQLLGIGIDVIPTFVFPKVDDKEFIQTIQSEAVAL